MANRKQRRAMSKQQRRENRLIVESIAPIKKQCMDKSVKDVWEKITPVFILYLVEHFHCKENGVIRFMNWFNEMQEWLDKYPDGFDEIVKELNEKANVTIEY